MAEQKPPAKRKTDRLDASVSALARKASDPSDARVKLQAGRLAQQHSSKVHVASGGMSVDEHVDQLRKQNQLIEEMGKNRSYRRGGGGGGSSFRLGRRTAAAGAGASSYGAGGDAYAATPRFYDPLEFWDLSGLPWNTADEGHRHKLHKWLRLFYSTHYLVPILIDIFTRFPLVGMELKCKDRKLAKFYEELFFDELDYPNFLVSLGREFWCVGEAFPLGSFDEDLGVWEREELINPEDVVIENFPLLGSKQLQIVPPDYLKDLAQTKAPAREYAQLEINFPELIPYLKRREHIPMSGVLLKQVANTLTTWDDHGTPILLRGLRTLIHEEKLLASQDAIAERLYSPLILARLGVMDLGDGQGPWIPSPDDLDAFRDDLDIALQSDFRVLVHHFGLEMENVFGREQMPRLGDDFDRIERRIMQIFGVNPSLLSAGANSQPYASSALQAEFLNQILRTFQGYLKKHFRARALVVAEAQEHWEYEKRGDKRVEVFEEVVVYDENGEKHIEERHKLLVPELEFATLDLRDEATERQFLQSLREMGVPIPDQKLMVGVKYDIKELTDEYHDELISKTISQQEAKLKTYKALDAAGLPIPPDLKAECESVLNKGAAPPGGGSLPAMPGGAGPGGPPMPPMGPPGAGGGVGQKMVMPGPPTGLGLGPMGGGPAGVPGGGPPPINGNPNVGNGFAPPASFERRPGMPSPTSRVANTEQSLDFDEEPAKVAPTRSRTEHEDRTVHELPKSAKFRRKEERKKYSIVDPDAEPLDEQNDDDESP